MSSILLLTLRTFSATGGIEKVCRVAAKAMQELPAFGSFRMYSLYDRTDEVNPAYVSAQSFRGFAQKKWSFIWQAFWTGRKKEIVLLSHLNLLPAALLLILLAPRVKIILFAHGIEVWKPLPVWKRWLLAKCDRVFAVSQYTQTRILELHKLKPERVIVVNNGLDPYLPPPQSGPKSPTLLKQFGFTDQDVIFLTLTRIASTEGYKGYDQVIRAVALLKDRFPHLKYVLVGKYDQQEKSRLDNLIVSLQVTDRVQFAGFVPDEMLSAYFHLADAYIMPSKKEGFGIVFIEALFYGKHVIAGNKDGSTDALQQGRFGQLIDPDRLDEICAAMESIMSNQQQTHPNPDEALAEFGFDAYKQKLHHALSF